jgi:hypothetical protein
VRIPAYRNNTAIVVSSSVKFELTLLKMFLNWNDVDIPKYFIKNNTLEEHGATLLFYAMVTTSGHVTKNYTF